MACFSSKSSGLLSVPVRCLRLCPLLEPISGSHVYMAKMRPSPVTVASERGFLDDLTQEAGLGRCITQRKNSATEVWSISHGSSSRILAFWYLRP